MSGKNPQNNSATQTTAAQQGLLGSIQSEVAREATPLLDFLSRNTGFIIGGFVLFIAIIGGYWFYTSQSQKSLMADQRVLGQFLVMADHEARIKALEGYLPNAPASTLNQAHLALAESAMNVQDFEKAFTNWSKLRGVNPEMTTLAVSGMAQSRKAQGNYAEALELYESILPGATGLHLATINREIIAVAEIAGNYQRAISASEALIASLETSESDRMVWVQKLHTLKARQEAAQAPTPAAETTEAQGAAVTSEQQGGN